MGSIHPSRRFAGILSGAALALVIPWTLHGQVVSGQVLDEGTRAPVQGAVVLLIDTKGTRVHAVLTDSTGRFALRAPRPATYRLRAEMIGRRNAESDAFELTAEGTVRVLEMPVQPVTLQGLDVRSSFRCRTRAEAAMATQTVWEQVRKALLAESVTRQQALYRFDITRFWIDMTRNLKDTVDITKTRVTNIAELPFATLEPDRLAQGGFARAEIGYTFLYAPDSNVLLSDAFHETHCMAISRTRRPGLIGLTFQPVPGRNLTDIDGTLWVDEATATLRTLEFRYRNVPRSMSEGAYTGFAEFQQLPDGAWIVRRWWIRSPFRFVMREVGGEVVAAQRAAAPPR
jgi:hypothetical protein